jgi:hypothetical protein
MRQSRNINAWAAQPCLKKDVMLEVKFSCIASFLLMEHRLEIEVEITAERVERSISPNSKQSSSLLKGQTWWCLLAISK